MLNMLNSRIGRKFKFSKFWWIMVDGAQFTSISTIIRLTNVDQISDSDFYRIHYIEAFTEDYTDRIEFTYRM